MCGLAEGAGLLFFQGINWERWGPTLHVSRPILSISPLFNVLFFLAIVLVLCLAGWRFPRLCVAQCVAGALVALTLYDWLMVTGRISRMGSVLLALGVGAAFSRWFVKHEAAMLRLAARTLPVAVAAGLITVAGVQGSSWLTEQRAVAGLPPAASNAPNVLIIVVDTLRADHLSSYGYHRLTSPNIDRMAQEGVLFENAVSTSSWTLPSHASLLTGRYEFEHGMTAVGPTPVVNESPNSLGGFPSLPELLAQRGIALGHSPPTALSSPATWASGAASCTLKTTFIRPATWRRAHFTDGN